MKSIRLIKSVHTKTVGRHEVTQWNDGSVSIEDPNLQSNLDDRNLDRISFSKSEIQPIANLLLAQYT